MRLCVYSLDLIGAERRLEFSDGLNIISGSMTTGKTSLMKCISGLLGGSLRVPRETRDNVSNLAGQVRINDKLFSVVRPFVTTRNAKVDIAGDEFAVRLPAVERSDNDPQTYKDWLLVEMGLPLLDVPTAPTQLDSGTSPLTISDYLLYCYLRQDEIDTSVFGHTDYSKNVKRKWVFEVLYGKFSIEISELQSKHRDLNSELRRLHSTTKTIREFLEGTNIQNRAEIQLQIDNLDKEILDIEKDSIDFSSRAGADTDTTNLKKDVLSIDLQIHEIQKRKNFEQNSFDQKNALLAQLQTFTARLTKAIVAEKYLVDYDFIHCPRCNSPVTQDRALGENCYLCLQTPSDEVSREDLISEQNRLEGQINETKELLDQHNLNLKAFDQELGKLRIELEEKSRELDFRTKTYLSTSIAKITELERNRSTLLERRKSFVEYLSLFQKNDKLDTRISEIKTQIQELEFRIEVAKSTGVSFDERVNLLERHFKELVEVLNIEKFPNEGQTGIDRKTYLPVYSGRKPEEWQSPGLTTMVNVAHAIAHQLTSLELDILLPNILIIDGLSNNLGYSGMDRSRIDGMYRYLIELDKKYKDRLQIIVADNSIPDFAEPWKRYEFNSKDKLIPNHIISRGSEIS